MTWIAVSGVAGALGVAIGAFGAHGLRDRLSAHALGIYQTGVSYHLVHALALLAVALYGSATGREVSLPAGLFCAGIVLFSGSLYALALSGITKLGAVTPLGGLAFIAAWIAVAVRLAR